MMKLQMIRDEKLMLVGDDSDETVMSGGVMVHTGRWQMMMVMMIMVMVIVMMVIMMMVMMHCW